MYHKNLFIFIIDKDFKLIISLVTLFGVMGAHKLDLAVFIFTLSISFRLGLSWSWESWEIRDVQIDLLDKYGLMRVHYGDVLDFYDNDRDNYKKQDIRRILVKQLQDRNDYGNNWVEIVMEIMGRPSDRDRE